MPVAAEDVRFVRSHGGKCTAAACMARAGRHAGLAVASGSLGRQHQLQVLRLTLLACQCIVRSLYYGRHRVVGLKRASEGGREHPSSRMYHLSSVEPNIHSRFAQGAGCHGWRAHSRAGGFGRRRHGCVRTYLESYVAQDLRRTSGSCAHAWL